MRGAWILLVAIAIVGGCGGNSAAGSTPISAACDAAFAKDETQLPGGKSEELLDGTISACRSVADWQAAWAKHPNAHGSTLDPILYLTGRCVDFPATAVCRELTAVPSVNVTGKLDPPKSSGIENMPIPESAETVNLVPSSSASASEEYEVPGATFDQLRAWYEQQLPEGHAFGQWTWCEKFVSDTYSSKIYTKAGTARLLTVLVTADTPPGILVAVDDSGPC